MIFTEYNSYEFTATARDNKGQRVMALNERNQSFD